MDIRGCLDWVYHRFINRKRKQIAVNKYTLYYYNEDSSMWVPVECNNTKYTYKKPEIEDIVSMYIVNKTIYGIVREIKEEKTCKYE